MLDAPTGSGKTLIAELVRQGLNARAVYCCTTLHLQEQFHGDFQRSAVLKGRSNYVIPGARPGVTASDCDKSKTVLPGCGECSKEDEGEHKLHCRWCHPITSCPYEQAKVKAKDSDLAVTNTSYYLHESNYIGLLKVNRQLTIIDEADTLEDQIMAFVGFSISEGRAKEYDLEPPPKKTVESSWVEWAADAQRSLERHRVVHHRRFKDTSVESIRYRKRFESTLDGLRRLNDDDRGLSSGNWVYTGYDRSNITFRPIRIDNYAYDILWRHCPRWLLMSATTISFQEVADCLGIP